MTPDEIKNWKAEQAKRPLAERLAEIPGYQTESSKPEQAQAEVGFDGKPIKRGQQ